LGVHENTSLEALDKQALQAINEIMNEVVVHKRDSILVGELTSAYGITNPRERTGKLRELLSSFDAA